MRLGAIVGATALATSLAGCGAGMMGLQGGGPGTFTGLGFDTGNKASWTILVHMCAANNLESFGLTNLQEMEHGLSSPDINVIVLFDGEEQGSSKILKITPGGEQVVDDHGAIIPPATHNIDSGDPATLARFTSWAVQNFPAQHYGLVIWDHGSGLFADGRIQTRLDLAPGVDRKAIVAQYGGAIHADGFCYSDKSGHNMNTKDVTTILQAGAQAAGQPFDFLGFDACLMSHVEMTYQMKGYARYLVASEEVEPGAGWDYNLWLQALSANPTADARTCATYAVSAWNKTYSPGGAHYGGSDPDATLAATSYDAVMGGVVPAIDHLAGDILANPAALKPPVLNARNQATHFYNADCVDIGSLAQDLAVSGVPQLKSDAQSLLSAYQGSIAASAHDGQSVSGATGQVIYFPDDGSYQSMYDDPGQIAFAAEPWGKALHVLDNQQLARY